MNKNSQNETKKYYRNLTINHNKINYYKNTKNIFKKSFNFYSKNNQKYSKIVKKHKNIYLRSKLNIKKLSDFFTTKSSGIFKIGQIFVHFPQSETKCFQNTIFLY